MYGTVRGSLEPVRTYIHAAPVRGLKNRLGWPPKTTPILPIFLNLSIRPEEPANAGRQGCAH
jgi:hypothetical protein